MTQGVYAHSVPGRDESVWEPLSEHLTAVASHAAVSATVFGGQRMAEAMGALHDVGKLIQEFQDYIRGKGTSVDHSTAGAVIARERYGAVLGQIMAFGIAGHHAGLANGRVAGGGISSLKERLDGKIPLPLSPDLDVAPATVTLSAPVLSTGFTHHFSLPFLIRMLFSCLVDADRLETERFYARFDAEARGKTAARGCPLTVEDLRDRLDAHLLRFKDKDGPVNALRAEVLAGVRAKAEEAPGLFSLTVPTGGGKTLASLAFALDHAVRHGLRRVIYVIPFTSIVEQTADVFREALGSDDAVLEHHSGFDFDPPSRKTRRKTAESDDEAPDGARKLRLASENWDRPVVVTTSVQFFESLFASHPSSCRKLHAIAGSVVILDEAQTLPLKCLRPCLETLRELARGYRTSVVLCTATQPAVTVEAGFAGGLDTVRELAPDPRDLYRRLKRVTVAHLPEPLDDETLAERLLDETQVLCIVNNRRHARDLLRRIRGEDGARHLSTCLCAAHRRAELASIREELELKRPVRLVSTSLVEAGVDFSFPTVYRAMAGLDSIAQAAGRCNRNGDLPELGRVFVFSSPEGEGRKPPPELGQFAEVAASVLRGHDDPLALDTLRAYFQRLYWQRGPEELDAALVGDGPAPIRGILKALDLYKSDREYPFADIAKAFRIIESPLVPVIVPYKPAGDPDVVQRLLETLKRLPAEKTGGIARALQPYLVQIPRSARNALLAAGSAECVRGDEFGDQFVSLVNGDLYHPDVGLDWEDPTFRKIETGIF
ncbi:CRISPR-associated endonuclease Cas3'' [Azospirillum doebereinerae]|uniref:CRISPR-associated endonuclease Cas3'' n=1 Tax=Azospirillum doebereinerae TaxID=92933 RepID=UPI001EE59B7D|nr:CRISPR-associated endonuclease Cas3'' [Azospirillum doebereinerae]MCG5242232.1 CRISPR-associated endonuclease Cas3'' [Azospirillum doebereinerae]